MDAMAAKSRLITASPSTESLGAWRISSKAAPSDGGGSEAVSSPPTPLPSTPTHQHDRRSPDGQELESPAAAPAAADKAAAAPVPQGRHLPFVPRPVYWTLRAIWTREELASLFDDAVLPDAGDPDADAEDRAGARAALAAPDAGDPDADAEDLAAGAALAAPGGDRPGGGLRQRQPAQQEQQQQRQEQEQRWGPDGGAGGKGGDADVQERVRLVRRALTEAAEAVRAENPLLYSARTQDAVGLAVLAGASLALLALFSLHYVGAAPWYAVVPAAALLTSLLHEVEHDLIHQLYFRGRRLSLPIVSSFTDAFSVSAVDAALALCYAFRPSTLQPFARRALHLHHHRAAGSASDLEERSITSGMPWGPLRLATTGDNLLAVLLRPRRTVHEMRAYLRAQPAAVRGDARARLGLVYANALGYAPLGVAHYLAWWSFLAVGLAARLAGAAPASLLAPALGALGLGGVGGATAAAASLWGALRFYAVTFGAPQFLRTFSLHAVSSNIHYYKGGRRAHSIVDQCQVVDSPLFWPLQLFCFNFGATHALHHFLPSQTFYVRQAVSARVRPALVAAGVRFNDLGTLARANRLPAA